MDADDEQTQLESRDRRARGRRHVALPRCSGPAMEVADRLGEQSIRELIADRRAGATKGELVERYGISMSSVKRLLKPDRMSCRAIR